MKDINVNNPQSVDMPTVQRKTTMYDLNKARYDEFVLKMNKSDMKNAYTRYLTERTMLMKMKEHAQKTETEATLQEIDSRIKEVETILKEQFGISYSENK